MIADPTQHALKRLSLGLTLLGLSCGILLSYGVLAGDAQGRVNLLFLLLLFAFLPVTGLLLSLFLLAKGGGRGLAGWVLDLPLWPKHLTLALPTLAVSHGRKLWLFYQTQVLSLSFSIGCMVLYLLLLLGSDISFVWRSTLLEPQDLLPALQAMALPWSFWPEAQASLALIEQTRDYRLESQGMLQPVAGLWWKYILAAQLCYNLLPRTLMLLVARRLYLKQLHEAGIGGITETHVGSEGSSGQQFPLAELVSSVASPYVLLDWAGAPAACYAQMQQQVGEAAAIHRLSPIGKSPETELPREHSLVVLVKSWEPPLAELADKLRGLETAATKLILPLDWNDGGIRQSSAAHLEEWRRFAATLPHWQVLQTQVNHEAAP